MSFTFGCHPHTSTHRMVGLRVSARSCAHSPQCLWVPDPAAVGVTYQCCRGFHDWWSLGPAHCALASAWDAGKAQKQNAGRLPLPYRSEVLYEDDGEVLLDSGCRIFQNLNHAMASHMARTDAGVLYNNVTGSVPLIFHGNGGGKEFLWEEVFPLAVSRA